MDNSEHKPIPATNPFSISYSDQFPRLLSQLGCSLAISTYQAGKVIMLSAQNDKLIQLPRNFLRPMGIAIEGDKMAVACKDEVLLLRNSSQLAWHYPKKPKTYDALYLPRITYHTGALDVHDLDFVGQDLMAVNTNFSCIIKIDQEHSFTPVWKPPFINKITSGDHCHLNGMAISGGAIKYVTAFGTTDSPRGWTSNLLTSGVVMDYASEEILCSGLAMPHSPRVHNAELYVLLSGTGELVRIDRSSGKKTVIWRAQRFLRGLAFYKSYAIVGFSKIRENSSSFGHLNLKANEAGLAIVELSSGKTVAEMIYTSSVDEIYDVQVIAGAKRPSILNTMNDMHKSGLSMPERTFWGRKKDDDFAH